MFIALSDEYALCAKSSGRDRTSVKTHACSQSIDVLFGETELTQKKLYMLNCVVLAEVKRSCRKEMKSSEKALWRR